MLELLNQVIIALAAGLLIPLFLFTGSIKVTRWHKYIASFQLGFMNKYGLSSSIYTLIGVAEIIGAIGLILQGSHVLGTLAAGGLFLLSAGAFRYHLKYDTFHFGIPALLFGSLSLIIFVSNVSLLAGLPNNLSLDPTQLSLSFSWVSVVPRG